MRGHRDARQSLILDIIREQDVKTQERLLEALRERGVSVTQATISRDIRQLRLEKDLSGRYRRPAGSGLNATEKLRAIFRESVLTVDRAQNLVVLRTMPGLAGAACSTLDHMDIPTLVGTLAGDDTAFIAMRDTEAAVALCAEIRKML